MTSTNDPSYDPTVQSLDPVLTQATKGPSPDEEKQFTLEQDKNIRDRISAAEAQGPTVRQRTQSEIIDLSLLANRLGNPFSIRWIPFEQLRDMTTDLMLAFGWWMTIGPLLRADFVFKSPDAQLAAAVDEAYRQIHAETMLAMSNALWYSHQPMVKQFKLGRLGTTYRDPNGKDPNAEIPVWDSSADALLWKPPMVLNPSHCLPSWNDDGQMVGFKFSNTPIPHFDLISAASAYGYMVIPGHQIDANYAVWVVNESHLEFGSCFGSARTKRAYPYWWSKWFRWHIADRAWENLADPPKYVYYPVDFDEFIDPDDPDTVSPRVHQARQTALDIGSQMRSGATTAFPGSFAEGADGKTTSHRKWEAGFFDVKNNFSDLDSGFKLLDIMLLRAWFLPEQSVVEGSGSRTSGGSAGGTGGARMATSLANVHEESQQPLAAEYDGYINDHWIPQFIASNFPEKIGTPCRKETRTMGQADNQTLSQVLQLIGQVRGEVIPVDVRALLKQLNVPLLNPVQMEAEIAGISKLQQIMGPPETPPEKVGTQGYNAGVMKTGKGNFYYQPSERILLAESDGFMNSLPDTQHFKGAGVRSALIRLRRILLERYDGQYKSFVEFLTKQPTLHLAQSGNGQKSGLDEQQAKASAAAIISAWAASQAPGAVGAAGVVTASGVGKQIAALTSKIAVDGGKGSLKGSRLAAEDFGPGVLETWVNDRVKLALNSIDDTVRTEAREWLSDELQQSVNPDQVAKAAREQFDSFPASHADRAARTECTEAFNAGSLEAFDRAGVSQVQVHDASDGANELTDSICRERNGRVVSVQDAKQLYLAHPNCTLGFSPLTTEKLSVERVSRLPEHLAKEGKHVAYDEHAETLYLTEQIDCQQEQIVLLMLGEQLSLR